MKKGPPPIVATCQRCGRTFTSRYQEKNHVCRER
jgi:hypothetical protein